MSPWRVWAISFYQFLSWMCIESSGCLTTIYPSQRPYKISNRVQWSIHLRLWHREFSLVSRVSWLYLWPGITSSQFQLTFAADLTDGFSAAGEWKGNSQQRMWVGNRQRWSISSSCFRFFRAETDTVEALCFQHPASQQTEEESWQFFFCEVN